MEIDLKKSLLVIRADFTDDNKWQGVCSSVHTACNEINKQAIFIDYHAYSNLDDIEGMLKELNLDIAAFYLFDADSVPKKKKTLLLISLFIDEYSSSRVRVAEIPFHGITDWKNQEEVRSEIKIFESELKRLKSHITKSKKLLVENLKQDKNTGNLEDEIRLSEEDVIRYEGYLLRANKLLQDLN